MPTAGTSFSSARPPIRAGSAAHRSRRVTLDTEDEEANKGAVQVPDPFLKNVLMRASYRVFGLLREKKIAVGFKDLGAGGIMGCSAEIASAGGFGAEIDLDNVNVAIENMPPEVIAIGETQERLIWVVPPELTAEILRIYNEEFTLPQIALQRARGRHRQGHGRTQIRAALSTAKSSWTSTSTFSPGSIRDELPVRRAVVGRFAERAAARYRHATRRDARAGARAPRRLLA